MSDAKQRFKDGLRPEAQAVEFGELSWSQVEAARDVVDALHSAYNEEQSTKVKKNRRNHILIISGEKGTGKTTLVHTLRSWFDAPSQLTSAYQDDVLERLHLSKNERAKYATIGNDLNKAIQSCKNVTWLDVLSLDPMLRGTNLVAAIFARITEAAARNSDDRQFQSGGLLDPVSIGERALHELGSLRSDAVMALEGNLSERAGGMDPESYAITATENEKKKMEVADRLNRVLRRLIEGATGSTEVAVRGLYILPIDDIDSAPERAVEMLKLAYSLSIPRLVFLLLGSADVADQFLFYHVQGELLQLMGSGEHLETAAQEQVTATANEIASSSLRKMVPPSQRIHIEPLTLEHARRFRAGQKVSGESSETLAARLRGIGFSASVFSSATTVPEKRVPPRVDLHSLLLTKDPFGDEEDYFYDGQGLLRTAPRQLSDLYSLVERASKQNPSQPAQPSKSSQQGDHQPAEDAQNDHSQLIEDLFTEALRPLIDEDGQLTPVVQREIKSCLQREELSRKIELTPPALRMVTETGDHFELEVDPFATPLLSLNPSCHIVSRRVRNLAIQSARPGAKERQLAESSRSTFKVIHDLIRFTGAGVVTASIPHSDRAQLAFTQWNDGINAPFEIPWLQTDWATFWHTDLFFRVWNRGLWKIRRICSEKADLRANDFGYLLAVTAAAALMVTADVRPKEVENEKSKQIQRPEPWAGLKRLLGSSRENHSGSWNWKNIGFESAGDGPEALSKTALALADHVQRKRTSGEDDDEADQIDAVLVNLALLMAPETGIPEPRQHDASHAGDLIPPSFHAVFNVSGKDYPHLLGHPYFQQLARKVRRKRLERMGTRASTLLGVALLNPRLAREIVSEKSVERGICDVIEHAQSQYPYFGKAEFALTEKGAKEIADLFCPTNHDLRQAFLQAERASAHQAISRHDLDCLQDYLVLKAHTRTGCGEPDTKNSLQAPSVPPAAPAAPNAPPHPAGGLDASSSGD